ncbi:MAG TPA: hypothetical protein VGK67_30550 [Myxococcales bacterium]|jgi:hypothetical protein
MSKPFNLLALATALLLAVPARAQDGASPYPAPPPPPAADVYIPPPPLPPPAWLPPPPPPVVPRRLRLHESGHQRPEHSDVGLGIGEGLAAGGIQLAATGVVTLSLLVFTLFADQSNMSNGDYLAVVGVVAALAPPLMALPSSAVASKISKKCPREHSWGFTYLAGVAASAATVGMAAAWVSGAFGNRGDTQVNGLLGSLIVGAFLTGGFESLTLNLTGGKQVAAAPMVLRDGGGASVAMTF